MLDERWSADAEEVGDALRRLLAAECDTKHVRAAEVAPGGRDLSLEAKLTAFGLRERDLSFEIRIRIAYELGRALAPVSFVESVPAFVVLGAEDVAYGFEGVVPASLSRVATEDERGVCIADLMGTPKRTSAGDWVIKPAPAANGERAGDASAASRMRRIFSVAGAARMIGAGQALLSYGAAYVAEREQFGKPIGAYQGVAHRLANCAAALDGAELLLRKAVFTSSPNAGGDGAPANLFAIMTRVKAIEAARSIATNVHQVFGANGFSMEYDVQLYSRRLRSWALRMDGERGALAEVGRAVLDPAKRDSIRLLWHYDQGMPLPRWAREADRLDRGKP